MAVSLLASLLIDGATSPDAGAIVSSPVPGYWYWLDAAWGTGPRDPYVVYATQIGLLSNVLEWSGGQAPYPPSTRTGISASLLYLLQFQPDGVQAYLGLGAAAAGRWRIQFPASGAASLYLAGTQLSWTVAAAAVVTLATVVISDPQPLGSLPARTVTISWNANYPLGGISLPYTLLGLEGPLWASINDVAGYRFLWQAGLLHVYAAGGSEVASGTALNFSTNALFLGAAA